MNLAEHDQHLPLTVSGLIGFALRGVAANAPLYLALAIAVFGAYALVEWLIPAAPLDTDQGQAKLFALNYTGAFADAFVIAAVALGVAACGLGTPLRSRTLLAAALERWLPVIAANILIQGVFQFTSSLGALGPPLDPPGLVYVTGPIVWVLWGVISLAPPLIALAQTRGGGTVLVGFGHAFTLSLRRDNVGRVCILSAFSVAPNVLAALGQVGLEHAHVTHSIFWSLAGVDALTVVPVSAIQTAFALDFVRRAGTGSRAQP